MAWYNMAALMQSRGKLSDARDCWREVVRRDPELASAHSSLGETLMDLHDPAGAADAYAEAARLEPKVVASWMNLCAAAYDAGSLGRAAVAIQKATALAPQDAYLWNWQGRVMLALHRTTGREDYLNKAVAAWRKSLSLDWSQKDLINLLQTYAPATQPAEASPASRPSQSDIGSRSQRKMTP
jgi:tetratricopeptide (TPR) repeat protein